MFFIVLAISVITFLNAPPAFAYIDPMTGSALMSIIIGFLVGAGVWIKIYWNKIISFFRKEPISEGEDPPKEKPDVF